MTLNYAYLTDIGKVRENNEDNFWCVGTYLPEDHSSEAAVHGQAELGSADRRDSAAFCVFDGMGGENRGETASYLAASCFGQYINDIKTEAEDDLSRACKAMNKTICDYTCEHQLGSMGTTAAMIRFRGEGDIAEVSNIGDSRIYRMREQSLSQLSVDHVLHHPFTGRRMLTQNLGIDEEQMIIEPFTTTVSVKEGDLFLICSDGLTDCCNDTVIQELLCRAQGSTEAVALLKEAALSQGAPDNITIIVCQIS